MVDRPNFEPVRPKKRIVENRIVILYFIGTYFGENWDKLGLSSYLRQHGWDRRDLERVNKLLAHFKLPKEKYGAAEIAVDRELKNIRSTAKKGNSKDVEKFYFLLGAFPCRCCNFPFDSRVAMKNHVLAKRAEEDACYACDVAKEMRAAPTDQKADLVEENIAHK